MDIGSNPQLYVQSNITYKLYQSFKFATILRPKHFMQSLQLAINRFVLLLAGILKVIQNVSTLKMVNE